MVLHNLVCSTKHLETQNVEANTYEHIRICAEFAPGGGGRC